MRAFRSGADATRGRLGIRARLLSIVLITSVTLVEVSAQLHVPLALTKVLIGDLVDDGRLLVRAPAETGDTADLGLPRTIANSLRGG